jgi:hypothetical protein
MRQIESLQLARKETARAIESTSQDARRRQLSAALADIDRRIAELEASAGQNRDRND